MERATRREVMTGSQEESDGAAPPDADGRVPKADDGRVRGAATSAGAARQARRYKVPAARHQLLGTSYQTGTINTVGTSG